MKDKFMKNGVFSLEYDKETLKDMVLELQEENTKLINQQKEIIDRLNFIKNRKNQGASQENINKMAIEFVNNYLKEVSE